MCASPKASDRSASTGQFDELVDRLTVTDVVSVRMYAQHAHCRISSAPSVCCTSARWHCRSRMVLTA